MRLDFSQEHRSEFRDRIRRRDDSNARLKTDDQSAVLQLAQRVTEQKIDERKNDNCSKIPTYVYPPTAEQ